MAEPVPVRVVALDPVLEAGTLAALALSPQLTRTSGEPPERPAGVVVLTVDRFGHAELELLRAARETAGRPAVVLVAGELAAADALHALAAGARALLLRREADPARLTEAVLAAAHGDCTLSPDLFEQVLGRSADSAQAWGARPGIVTGLSDRERAVLRMVAEGHETSEIATHLAYSQRTVTTVLHDITQRFRLRNRAHAVAYALRAGML
ncbi:helix-turn-helix transcriptional regulator [Streptacidiphilus jiangxiensis]|uniref:DNA-binding response regulator, NarL/FixJ family, contains REC and HTH domains n=1 Tax=Streptacidiphilus jiangxiensis TaxID=235985 RepID=A0A1H7RE72_STRJI|nr:LuxR C-terminal-related transcriptional regulator [Streptacidiphilus jiangxiensis]SEL58258.1 DNA-binding response regulator, NarL/FixJ family, contains REC and HTH domains [Streptacidiphilus jiangxiensis]